MGRLAVVFITLDTVPAFIAEIHLCWLSKLAHAYGHLETLLTADFSLISPSALGTACRSNNDPSLCAQTIRWQPVDVPLLARLACNLLAAHATPCFYNRLLFEAVRSWVCLRALKKRGQETRLRDESPLASASLDGSVGCPSGTVFD